MRTDLQNGDILLFKPASLLEDLIDLGENDGNASDDKYDEYIHAAIVSDISKFLGFQMIAPKSGFFDLRNENWSKIDVFRPNQPLDITKLQHHLYVIAGTPYPFAEDAKFLLRDIFDREGLTGLGTLVDSFKAENSPKLQVCSATVCEAVSFASTGPEVKWPLAVTDCRPADIPNGPVHFVPLEV
jgi:hypothetical protein